MVQVFGRLSAERPCLAPEALRRLRVTRQLICKELQSDELSQAAASSALKTTPVPPLSFSRIQVMSNGCTGHEGVPARHPQIRDHTEMPSDIATPQHVRCTLMISGLPEEVPHAAWQALSRATDSRVTPQYLT